MHNTTTLKQQLLGFWYILFYSCLNAFSFSVVGIIYFPVYPLLSFYVIELSHIINILH